MAKTPIVMTFAGLDPSGGAGISADIETLRAFSCHCLPIITTITTQTTKNVISSSPVMSTLIKEQIYSLLAEFNIHAIKIGLVDNIDVINIIHEFIIDNPNIPVIIDPIIWAGGGKRLQNQAATTAIKQKILPFSFLATPNLKEAAILAGMPENKPIDEIAAQILTCGIKNILITTTDSNDNDIITHWLFSADNNIKKYSTTRLQQSFHGSGCTLTAAITAALAQGITLEKAINIANKYTTFACQHAYKLTDGQLIPNRKNAYEK